MRMPRPGMVSDPIDRLESAIYDMHNGLSRSDREFGSSLVNAFRRYGKLTPKQEPWVEKLLERAESDSTTGTMKPKQVEHNTIELGDMSRIFKMFQTAFEKDVQKPTIKFRFSDAQYKEEMVRLWVGKDRNMVQVTIGEDYETRQWIGAFDVHGHMKMSQKAPVVTTVLTFIKELAANPSKVSGATGRRMKWCCFCGRPLTTTDSLYYGYGPICAENFGLEWGEAKARIVESNLDAIGQFVAQEMSKL